MNCKTFGNILLKEYFPFYTSCETLIAWNASQSIWYLNILEKEVFKSLILEVLI